ncbi:hypothetical protein EW146_g1377 [Bondarzewia mesenterica]|uniref:Uncharacterized protein n=1 Tax=Bondarzewia mesenterica TaxID=1095465 RepID=A0A4S4M3Y6_9AGAM|nr:hypothetical protein EW146_g1377 [Bondarzewia mesenterica]
MDILTQTFPVEILERIFLYCVDYGAHTRPSRAPILLTRISRSWRAVALSTPRLWSHLCLSDVPTNKFLYFASSLKKWLFLSKSVLLDLCLRISEDRPRDQHIFLVYMLILCAHSARWQYIDVKLPYIYIFRTFCSALEQCRSLPLLEIFQLDAPCDPWTPGPSGLSILESAPRLCRALITPYALSSWSLPWSQLTHLDMRSHKDCHYNPPHLDLGLVIESLSECANLDVLCFDGVFYPLTGIHETSKSVVLPKLRRLDLRMRVSEAQGKMDHGFLSPRLFDCFTHLILPKLRVLLLSIDLPYGAITWDESFLRFFTHFSGSLTHLAIDHCPLPHKLAVDILARLPNLRTLRSMPKRLYDSQPLLLDALTIHPTPDGAEPLAPKLSHMLISRTTTRARDEHVFHKELVSMVKSRWRATPDAVNGARSLKRLSLDQEVWRRMRDLSPKEYHHIAKCIKEGLELWLINVRDRTMVARMFLEW